MSNANLKTYDKQGRWLQNITAKRFLHKQSTGETFLTEPALTLTNQQEEFFWKIKAKKGKIRSHTDENKRFVEIINRLKTMVENDEISENEAMFRYLNLIELEESKFQYTNNKNFNYGYYPSYNDFYVRGMLPFYFRNGYFY